MKILCFFLILSALQRVNTLYEGVGKSAREVLSYNIFRGLVEDMANATNWTALNTAPLTEEVFVDNTWSIHDPLEYTYAVEAVYAENNAELSFSNFIAGFTASEENITEALSIYPIPASSTLFIHGAEGARISIYNMLGELVYQDNNSQKMERIDVSSLHNGNYIIQIVGDYIQQTKKLVVAK